MSLLFFLGADVMPGIAFPLPCGLYRAYGGDSKDYDADCENPTAADESNPELMPQRPVPPTRPAPPRGRPVEPSQAKAVEAQSTGNTPDEGAEEEQLPDEQVDRAAAASKALDEDNSQNELPTPVPRQGASSLRQRIATFRRRGA